MRENLLRLQQIQNLLYPQIQTWSSLTKPDDRHAIKPQIYLIPQHIKRMQLHNQSLAIIIHKLRKDNVNSTTLTNTYFLDDDVVLCWSVREGVHICKAMVVLKMLQQLVLTMMHDLLGHNGTTRLYNYIRQFHFWQELKQDCANHIHKCKDLPTGFSQNQTLCGLKFKSTKCANGIYCNGLTRQI